jgi:hypothetical protein
MSLGVHSGAVGKRSLLNLELLGDGWVACATDIPPEGLRQRGTIALKPEQEQFILRQNWGRSTLEAPLILPTAAQNFTSVYVC